MNKMIAFGALALSLISSVAVADERRGSDAALGALSGAVVFGPVGALAGAAFSLWRAVFLAEQT